MRYLILTVTFAISTLAGYSQSVKLAWDPPDGCWVAGYNVYRFNVSGGPYQKLNQELIGPPFYADLEVEPGGTFYYVVTSVDIEGLESAYSSEVKAKVELELMSVSAGPDLEVYGGELVLLTANCPVMHAAFLWMQATGPIISITEMNMQELVFLAPEVTSQTELVFEVKAVDGVGREATDMVMVTILPPRTGE